MSYDPLDPKEFANWVSEDFDSAIAWLRDRIESMEGDGDYVTMRALFLLVLIALGMRDLLASGDKEYIAQNLAKLSIKADEQIEKLIDYWTVQTFAGR